MRIAIYTKGGDYLSDDELSSWLNIVDRYGIKAIFNDSFAIQARGRGFGNIDSYSNSTELPDDTELIISYGGDGTFLQCVRMLCNRDIPVMGVNSGRLGFLANVPRVAVDEVFEHIKNKNYKIEKRSVVVTDGLGCGLNEFTLQKEGANMLNIKLKINGEHIVEYKADGLIVSTPTGTTAYSMSLGGPIVAPTCDCFVIIPIAPHNLTMRPLVVEGNAEIEIVGYNRSNRMFASLDNEVFTATNGQVFTIRRKFESVKIAQLPETSFFETIRKKLMWGMDSREGKL